MTNEMLYALIADVDESFVSEARNAPPKRSRRWIAPLAAACLVLVLLVGLPGHFEVMPSPTLPSDLIPTMPTFPEPTMPDIPLEPNAPLYNYFDSGDQLLALLQATKGSEEEYLSYIATLSAPESGWILSTQAGGKEFIDWLRSTPLPCRADAEETFHALYYYTRGAIKGFELFYDIDGRRYNLFCMDADSAPVLEGECVGTVTLDGHSVDLYEMEYGTGTRLFGNCFVGEQVLRIWIDTTDIEQVDLSGFYLGDLLESFS